MNDRDRGVDHKGRKTSVALMAWLGVALLIAFGLLWAFTSRVAEPAGEQRAPLNETPPAAR
ncbi:hypothetical protein [Sphingomonas pseudosanguinis]|uniref:Uncharacterized protein n=1 Tax=Sphingomonas pseudosanguinis TaxID=413712 RepID=A0A7W6F301_9SPHN|nr:hypothetical protein [Sphingomonas pseudosanguinis]MBB3878820.1 hypothetical protein [Sphingomonas pseudosanguinis]MBN3536561.1 hypothetical protein [Sphingomonas pseudosanguinis]